MKQIKNNRFKFPVIIMLAAAFLIPSFVSGTNTYNLLFDPFIIKQDTVKKISYRPRRSFMIIDGISRIELQSRGEIKVSDDDTKIVSISPGGFLKFSKKTFGIRRSIIIESDSDGNLKYEYYEGRKEVPYEPEGRRWLADVL